MKKDIRQLKKEEIINYFVDKGEKAFRAKQVWEWLWTKSARSFPEMTNLSKDIREQLEADFEIRPITVDTAQYSNDGTIKSAFRLFDNEIVEGVLIPADDRMTACVSSQVGCSLSCKFCATGYMDRKRNLEPGEIYDQVVEINRQANKSFNQPLSNIVLWAWVSLCSTIRMY